MFISNREALQNLANGVCPAPQTIAPQIVVAPAATADCQSVACPAPTRQGIAIDPNKLFSENCGEIVISDVNTGDTSVTMRFGLYSHEGSYAIDATSPTAVDSPAVHTNNEAYVSAGSSANAPDLQYLNIISAFSPILVSNLTITRIASTSQFNQPLRVIQRSSDPAADECFKTVRPSICDVCQNNVIDSTNRSVNFPSLGAVALDVKNGFEYVLEAGSDLEFRLCIAGEADQRVFNPCE